MTTSDKSLYGPFVRSVELRQEIVRRAEVGLQRAVQFRNLVGIVATVCGLLHLVMVLAIIPRPDWVSTYSVALTLGFGGAWLFAGAHLWCCRHRAHDSREALVEYLSNLPIPAGSRRSPRT